MKCEICGSDMKPLFTSSYCPNDCDKEDTEVTAIAKIPTKENSISIGCLSRPETGHKFSYPSYNYLSQACFAEKYAQSQYRAYNLQVHDEIIYEPADDYNSRVKKLYKLPRQTEKSTLHRGSSLVEIIKAIMYEHRLKEVQNIMYSKYDIPLWIK